MSDLDASEIECPRCGERMYIEVQVCPGCGLHLYGSDLDEAETDPHGEPPGRSVSLVAVLVGGMAAGALAFLLQRAAALAWGGQPGGTALLAAGPLGALAGGYLAGVLARDKGPLHGLLVGIIALAPAYLLEAYWRDLASEPIGAAALAGWTVMVASAVLGGWIWEQLSLRAAARQLFSPSPRADEKSLYLELLAQVRHDIDAAERLVAFEQHRSPTLSRAAAIHAALDRLARDRR
jgi:hypothetical protein